MPNAGEDEGIGLAVARFDFGGFMVYIFELQFSLTGLVDIFLRDAQETRSRS